MWRVIHRTKKLAGLDPQERVYLYEAIGHLAWARVELIRKPPQAIVESLKLKEPAPSPIRGGSVDLAKLAWAICAGASGVPWRSDCLIQSLAADRWLKQKGVAHEFRLGVRQDDTGSFLAHAWIEVDGIPVTGGDDVVHYRLLISA